MFDDFNQIRLSSLEYGINSTRLFKLIRCNVPVFISQTDFVIDEVAALDQITGSALTIAVSFCQNVIWEAWKAKVMRSTPAFRNVVTCLTILCTKLYGFLTAYAVSVSILVSIAFSDI